MYHKVYSIWYYSVIINKPLKFKGFNIKKKKKNVKIKNKKEKEKKKTLLPRGQAGP